MNQLNGMVLSLFPQRELMEDAHLTEAGRGARFTFAHCMRSTEEVDALFAQLKKHMVTIAKEPQKVFWGRLAATSPIPMGTSGRSRTIPSW